MSEKTEVFINTYSILWLRIHSDAVWDIVLHIQCGNLNHKCTEDVNTPLRRQVEILARILFSKSIYSNIYFYCTNITINGMSMRRKENPPCLICRVYSSCPRAHVCGLDGLPKSRPSCQNLFVCQYWHSPFHNFSQGQLDLAVLTGEMIEDIIGPHQQPSSPNRAHTRAHTL